MRPSELTFLNHHIVYLASRRVVEARTMLLCSLFIFIFFSGNILFLDANARCPSGTYESSIGDCLPIGESPDTSIMSPSPIQSMLDASNSIVSQLTSSINHCTERAESGDRSQVETCDKVFLSFGQHMKSFLINYREGITDLLSPKTILIPSRIFNPNNASSNAIQVSTDVQDLVPIISQLAEIVKSCSNLTSGSESTLISNCENLIAGIAKELDAFKMQNIFDINSLTADSISYKQASRNTTAFSTGSVHFLTYKSPLYGVKFSYPEGSEIHENPNTIVILFPNIVNDPEYDSMSRPGMSIEPNMKVDTGYTLDSLTRELISIIINQGGDLAKTSSKIISINKTKISNGSVDANLALFEFTIGAYFVKEMLLVAIKDGFSTHISVDMNPEQFERYYPIVKKIIDSFEFVSLT